MLRNYIGLSNSPHDPALAIVNSMGDVVFAEATERYVQNKRAWNCVPDDIIRIEKLLSTYCDRDAELVIATTWSTKLFGTSLLGKFARSIIVSILERKRRRSLPRDLDAVMANLWSGLIASHQHTGSNLALRWITNHHDGTAIKRCYEHHLTHAMAACSSSPFDEALCAVIDGYGEGSSAGFFSYRNGALEKLRVQSSEASLGFWYAELCQMCGFDPVKGEEWKVMGLAGYGKFNEELYRILRSHIKVDEYRLVYGSPGRLSLRETSLKLKELSLSAADSPLNAADLAYTGQYVFCEIITELLTNLRRRNTSSNLVLAGGCALNSACNGVITERTPFRNLYVFMAPADDGNAVGAALLGFYEDHGPAKARAMVRSPYLGEPMSEDTLDNLKKYSSLKNTLPKGKQVHERAAELLAAGKIIGWVQGRAEFGPRALGNRSILADPRPPNVKEVLNARVKFREEFRPFAPAILHEFGSEYFENYQESPYMDRTLRFKKEVMDRVPGVVHVDGTGRLQTVKYEWNEKYYNLISAFRAITGIPIVLNTSLNIMGKPIIHSVEDAVALYFTTGLDALIVEDLVLEKDACS
jgi:carbamoyltransferase